jgi:hypothetical protein
MVVVRRDAGCYLRLPAGARNRRQDAAVYPSTPVPPLGAGMMSGENGSRLFKHDLWLRHSID